jgi:hypothetical protein
VPLVPALPGCLLLRLSCVLGYAGVYVGGVFRPGSISGEGEALWRTMEFRCGGGGCGRYCRESQSGGDGVRV